MHLTLRLSLLVFLLGLSATALTDTPGIENQDNFEPFSGVVDGKEIYIERNDEQENSVSSSFGQVFGNAASPEKNAMFGRRSRVCPPFCIQPIKVAPGVDTIGELELIDYIRQMTRGNKSLLLIDSRTPDWMSSGTIPGAINIPWTNLDPGSGAKLSSIVSIMTNRFGATRKEGLWDFSTAKTLIFFCNGMWCGQSSNNILHLLRFGYPSAKIKWYRGGMQSWEILGFEKSYP